MIPKTGKCFELTSATNFNEKKKKTANLAIYSGLIIINFLENIVQNMFFVWFLLLFPWERINFIFTLNSPIFLQCYNYLLTPFPLCLRCGKTVGKSCIMMSSLCFSTFTRLHKKFPFQCTSFAIDSFSSSFYLCRILKSQSAVLSDGRWSLDGWSILTPTKTMIFLRTYNGCWAICFSFDESFD